MAKKAISDDMMDLVIGGVNVYNRQNIIAKKDQDSPADLRVKDDNNDVPFIDHFNIKRNFGVNDTRFRGNNPRTGQGPANRNNFAVRDDLTDKM